jgi:hypothetical protein
MGTHRQTLLYDLATVVTVLRGEVWVDSYHLMTSSCSLFFKDVEKCAPTGVHDALCERMVLHHVENGEVLNRNHLILFGIAFGRLIVKITALPLDLEMRLCCTFRGFSTAVTTLLAPCYQALLPPERLLRGAIESGVLNGLPVRVSQEHFQTNVKTNLGMGTLRWFMLSLWLHLTDNECIPMPVGTEYQVNSLGCALYRAMQLDFEEVTELLGNDEMLLLLMQIAVLPVLPQLNRVPAVRLLETREADAGNSMLLCGKKAFEGFRKAVCQHLHGRGGYMCTLSFESRLKIVLAGESAILLILRLDHLQHRVIDATRLDQALHEPGMLSLIHEKAVFKSSHGAMLPETPRTVKQAMDGRLRRWSFTLMSKARGPHATLW